ncbi:MAG: sigma-70 family RNA polymerase sigma factor [Rikenellaceae bacterium]|nr:sigma-70 family RNA polymerase sigma factor [Rikenellaceae bacterium]
MNHEEELRLIRRVLGGDAEAFAPLVERYSRPIFSLVYGIVGRREQSEELTQDIFVKAYTKLSTYRGASSFSTWLYRIACNMALSAVRPKRYTFSLFDEKRVERLVDGSEQEQAELARIEERERMLLQALDRLAPEERALVQLHYYENRPLAECGEILGLTENNSKVRLHRIRKKLELWINEKS